MHAAAYSRTSAPVVASSGTTTQRLAAAVQAFELRRRPLRIQLQQLKTYGPGGFVTPWMIGKSLVMQMRDNTG